MGLEAILRDKRSRELTAISCHREFVVAAMVVDDVLEVVEAPKNFMDKVFKSRSDK